MRKQIATHTFSTGYVVGVRRVSPFLEQQVRRALPAPQPPVVAVEYPDGAVQEPNPDDPDYAQAVEDHETEIYERVAWLTLLRGTIIPASEYLRGLRALKRDFDLVGVPWPGPETDKRRMWLEMIAAGDASELRSLIHAIRNASIVAEEAVQEWIAVFRRDISSS